MNNTQIEISCVNELFDTTHIHLSCTLPYSYLPHPFAFTSFPFDCLICFEKVLSWNGTEKKRLGSLFKIPFVLLFE